MVHQVVQGMADGSVPCDHAVLRRVSSLVNSLPALDSKLLANDLNSVRCFCFYNTCTNIQQEHADTLLVLLLSSMTKSGVALGDVLDKFYTAFDKPKRKSAAGGW